MADAGPRRRPRHPTGQGAVRAAAAAIVGAVVLLCAGLAMPLAPATVRAADEAKATSARAAPRGSAQAGTPPLRDYAIDAWTTRNGLPHNSLRDIAQTPEGYLWFATWEGVVRYNGVAFTVFDRGSQPGLRDNGVGALYVDPAGRLWLSDSRGNLGRLEADGQWRFSARSADWPQVLVHDLAMDRQGRMWLLFEGRGLGCVHPDGRFEYFDPPPQIPLQASFPHMAVDAAGRVWIGTLEGLVMRDAGGGWHRYGAAHGLPAGLVWPYLAPDGTVWLAAEGHVFRLEGERVLPAFLLPGSGHVTTMLVDRHGAVWVGTENRGVARIGARGVSGCARARFCRAGAWPACWRMPRAASGSAPTAACSACARPCSPAGPGATAWPAITCARCSRTAKACSGSATAAAWTARTPTAVSGPCRCRAAAASRPRC